MNEEENSFDRSEGNGQDARELHSFGGMKDESPEETKTENEELADAIEELESNEVEASVPKVKEEPVFKSEPVKKEEPVMTIDSVKEPKEKKCGGAGWKVATFIFAVFAILGAGAACYLFFSDGTTKFLGREISSKPEGSKKDNSSNLNSAPVAEDEVSGKYIYLNGTDWALKIPDNLEQISYRYDFAQATSQYNGSEYSHTLKVNAITKNTKGYQAAPMFLYTGEMDEFQALGVIDIASGELKPEIQASAPEFKFKLDDKWSVYYSQWQSLFSNYGGADWEKEWELETHKAIDAWLTNKDNYVKVK